MIMMIMRIIQLSLSLLLFIDCYVANSMQFLLDANWGIQYISVDTIQPRLVSSHQAGTNIKKA